MVAAVVAGQHGNELPHARACANIALTGPHSSAYPYVMLLA